ncbi:hypothetical protein jhhlp_005507 [Lomentospora prolificans]|uniref:Disintegrin and metalloproteinase domain-containing protein B n=1 Tax=Lomentospora prolificans TaxID=41688 RepID=A0A2N3N3A2_9PEZI|nr:hypothetical protein jhhlp_005507 [Lomentospora prolificans]
MLLQRLLTAAFASVALLVQPSQADSSSRNPITTVFTLQDPNIQSSSLQINSNSKFELLFTIPGEQRIRLSLEPNHDVLPRDLHVTYLEADGSVRAVDPVDRAGHRVYRGSVYAKSVDDAEWVNGGWARITLRRDGKNPIFEGAFRLHGDHHHIQTVANYMKLKHAEDPLPSPPTSSSDDYMVLWRDSDIVEHWQPHDELRKRELFGRAPCGSDDLMFNANYGLHSRAAGDFAEISTPALFGRQADSTAGGGGAGINLIANIGSTAGCPKTRKVALLGVAADCNYRKQFDSEQEVRENIIQQINAASAVYENTFNITLGLQNITLLSADCPSTATEAVPWNVACSNSVTITDRLSKFSEWRGRSEDTNAFWTLLTTCNTDSAVGLAWLGQVCQQGSRPNEGDGSSANETISSTNVVVRTQTEWQVIAHEVGHTFGAVHDCTSTTCSAGDASTQRCCPLSANSCDAKGEFIMNPSTGRGIESFSPCSIGNVCAAVNRQADRCLVNNKDVPIITGQQCGNGIVEPGEDCDCGGEQGCSGNSCCDPETCKYTENSVCDPANEECCTDTCVFASAGTVCRASTGLCDPEEKCSGETAACPSDTHLDDGASCGDNGDGLTCASGQCTSRDLQCQAMMGSFKNITNVKACDETACMIGCSSSQTAPNQCSVMNQYFLDGTPCPGGGKCQNGICQGSSFIKEAGEFFTKNKKVIVPVVSVVGGLIVIAICWCIFSSIRRRRAMRKNGRKGVPPMMGVPSHNNNAWSNFAGAYGPRAPNQSQRSIPRSQQRGGPSMMSGSSPAPMQQSRGPGPFPPPASGPPPPYPAFQPYQPQWGGQGRSTRYA